MNELIPADPEYKKVLSSYYDLIKKSILRDDKEEFVGGLPITLLRKHLFNLFEKSSVYSTYSKYTVTSKVDGTRLLMFINEPDTNNPGFRKVHFIDRSLKIYTLSNKEKHILNSVRGPKMLLDGELVFFKDKKSHYYLESFETEYLSFMVFDILYGPITVKLEDPMIDTIPTLGSANAMAGPVGGKQWPYGKRLNILKSLMLPFPNNGNNPFLSLAFCNSPFFRVELKRILYVSELPNKPVVEYVNQDFIDNREKFYNFLSTKCDTKSLNEKYIKSSLEFDGLIFTPIDTEYVTENWNKFMNTQYKWKPDKEQTIDFYVENTSETKKIRGQLRPFTLVNLYVLSRGKLQLFDFNGKTQGLVDSKFIVPDGSIAEFGYSPKFESFTFNRLRLDKDRPNAWRTAETVKTSILNPVDINILPTLFHGDSSTIIKSIPSYLDKKQINRLMLCTGSVKLITDSTKEIIKKMLKYKTETKEAEVEIRIGNIKGSYFNTNVSRQKFIETNILFDSLGWKHQLYTYIDTNKDNIRTRYQYIPELKQLIKVQSINKESVSKIDVDTAKFSSFDLRFSTAKEELSDITVAFDQASRITEKKRISYIDPNKVISVDLTEVTSVNFQDNAIKTTGKSTYQIEFEVLKNDLQSVMSFLEYYITQIETTWD